MTGAPNGAAPRAASGQDVSRRQAALLVTAVTAVGLVLRTWELGFGLPHVLHSDHAQVEQAADLLATGGYADRAPYPQANVLVLAGLDAAVGGLGLWSGRAPWTDWPGFLDLLSHGDLGHRVARWWSAIAGALLAPVAYRLARLALDRGPALLASASVALCPIAVAVSHLARIHAPGVTLVSLAAIPALQLVRRPDPRRALAAGAAIGVAAAFIQLGLLLAAATVVQLLVATRPLSRAVRIAATCAVAVVAVAASLEGLAHLVADIRPGRADLSADTLLTLGIPAVTLGLHWERLPQLATTWVLGEPVRAALAVVGVIAAALSRDRRRVLLLYGAYPLLVLAVLGSNYTQARYVLSLTAFLAPLAVLGLLLLRPRALRLAVATLLVVSPLVASVRYDLLLGAGDTRLQLAAALGRLDDPGGPALIEDRLLLRDVAAPPCVRRFPEAGNFKPWVQGETSRSASFAAAAPVLFVREPARGNRLAEQAVSDAGLRLVGRLEPGSLADSGLPDPTEAMAIDVWRVRRSGPAVEVWAKPGEPTRVAQALVRP